MLAGTLVTLLAVLLATVEDTQRGIDYSSSRYDLVILDFTKTFDKVSFNRLIFKLKQGSGYGYGTVPGGRWTIDTEGGHMVVSVYP